MADIEFDRDRRDAVLWNFTVLGEAVAQLSDETQSSHPEVDWGAPVRMRNRIVHGDSSIGVELLTATARDDLPAFLAAVPRDRAAGATFVQRTMSNAAGIRRSRMRACVVIRLYAWAWGRD